MTYAHLLAFNVALLAAIVSPGPAFIIAVRTTLSAGRRAGVAIGCGLGLMAATWTLMALLGLRAAFELFPWAYGVGKIAGAIYLLYVAWKMWTGARQPIEVHAQVAERAFRQGFLVNLLNPKSVLFAGAVLILALPQNMTWIENAIVALNHLVVEIVFYTALAFCMSRPFVSRQYLRAKFYVDRVSSIVLGELGLRLLSDR
jgi:threonine/homoserine/homoserine lactone efflux protein